MNELDDSHSRYALSDPIKLLQPSLLLIEDDPQMGGILMELLRTITVRIGLQRERQPSTSLA